MSRMRQVFFDLTTLTELFIIKISIYSHQYKVTYIITILITCSALKLKFEIGNSNLSNR